MARFKQALWEDPDTKQRIKCHRITDEGSSEMIISRDDKDNWDLVIQEFSEEDITKATDEDIRLFREGRDHAEAQERDNRARQEAEMLFADKLVAMELPEVRECTNKKIKRRIRKASTFVELAVYTAAVISYQDRRNGTE
jgi:hypothetical protein